MKRIILLAILLVAAIAAVVVFRPREAVTVTYEAVSVQHGTLTDELHELGELVPRDPILVKAPFSGRLRFMVDDGAWVDKGNAACVEAAKRIVFDPARAADGKTKVRVWQGVGFMLD